MVVPLVVLAVLATIGGFVGIGPAFKALTGSTHPGGKLNIVNWMNPIIWDEKTGGYRGSHAAGEGTHAPVAETSHATPSAATATTETHGESHWFNLAHAVDNVIHNHTLTEWIFIIISLLVAGLGIGLGFLFYVKDPRLPDLWAQRLRPLYNASYNKYWVDEFFGWAVTRRVMDAARAVFTFDSKVVDGLVNGSAWLTRLSSRITGGTDKYFVDGLVNTIAAFIVKLMSPLFRAAQTGFAQNYALVMVLGLAIAVVIFFGSEILAQLRAIFAIYF